MNEFTISATGGSGGGGLSGSSSKKEPEVSSELNYLKEAIDECSRLLTEVEKRCEPIVRAKEISAGKVDIDTITVTRNPIVPLAEAIKERRMQIDGMICRLKSLLVNLEI